MIQFSFSGAIRAFRRLSLAAAAASVTTDSPAAAYANDSIPARCRSFPVGMPNAASTSSDGTIREPNATPENRSKAESRPLNIRMCALIGPCHCERLNQPRQERCLLFFLVNFCHASIVRNFLLAEPKPGWRMVTLRVNAMDRTRFEILSSEVALFCAAAPGACPTDGFQRACNRP